MKAVPEHGDLSGQPFALRNIQTGSKAFHYMMLACLLMRLPFHLMMLAWLDCLARCMKTFFKVLFNPPNQPCYSQNSTLFSIPVPDYQISEYVAIKIPSFRMQSSKA